MVIPLGLSGNESRHRLLVLYGRSGRTLCQSLRCGHIALKVAINKLHEMQIDAYALKRYLQMRNKWRIHIERYQAAGMKWRVGVGLIEGDISKYSNCISIPYT